MTKKRKYSIAQTGGTFGVNAPIIPSYAQGKESTNIKPNQTLSKEQLDNNYLKKIINDTQKQQVKGITKKQFEQGQSKSISEILLNPLTAAKRLIHNQPLNEGFSNDRNIYDNALDIINPATYIKAAGNTIGNALHPINTLNDLGAASNNLVSNLVDGRNIYNDGSNQRALGIIGDAAMAGTIPSLSKNVMGIADKQFSQLGQNLERIRYEGEAAGLDTHTISKNQMEQVGITSNQRQAYRPLISDAAEKYIFPYNYQGYNNENKVQQIFNNIKKGGYSRLEVDSSRADAWNLYLGKPQNNNTFSMAETAPVNHPSYSAGSLKDTDIYSINKHKNSDLLIPDNDIDKLAMLENRITIDTDQRDVMGGYNKLLNQDGLQYNDIWDLQPSITPSSYVPEQFNQTKLGEKLLYKKFSYNGDNDELINTFLPKHFKLDAGKVLGKPFMSHDVLPDFKPQNLFDDLHNTFTTKVDKHLEYIETLNKLPNANPFLIKANQDIINKTNNKLERLKGLPKFQNGGNNQYADTSIFNLIGQYAQQQQTQQPQQQTDQETPEETVAPTEEQDIAPNNDYQDLQDKYSALEERVNNLDTNYTGDDNFLNFLFDDSKNNDPIDFNAVANKKEQYKQNLSIPTTSSYSPVESQSSGTYTSPVSGKFQAFNSPESGRAALERQLDLYKSGQSRNTTGNETLYQAMGIYAPSSDGNNPRHYAEFIAKKIGVDPNTPIKQIDTKKWADAVTQMEGNKHGNNPGNLRPYQTGGSVSEQGYNYDSPYKNQPYLDIHSPTGNITMENTRIPLLGVDEFGNKQLMKPGQKYKFQGQNIREIKL